MGVDIFAGVKIPTAELDLLAEKERGIVAFIEDHLIDKDGLLYCYLNAETLKPWTEEEFVQNNYTTHFHKLARGNAMGALAYEDSLMATAEYALSRIDQYEQIGAPLALVSAAGHVDTILSVFREGEKFELGYLPKPHGGLDKASWSHEISHDQYIKSVVALRRFQPYAPPARRRAIDRYLVAAADYFIVRNFHYPRRESMVVTPETRAHTLAFFVPILVIAGKITGKPIYKEKLARFDALLTAIADGAVIGDLDHPNANVSSLFIEGFHLALSEGHNDERLIKIIGTLWDKHPPLLGPDGLGPEDSGQKFRSARILRVAAFAPIVDRYFPEKHAWMTSLKMLRALNDPHRTLCSLDPGSSGHDPYWNRTICELGLTSWLSAYWRLVAAANTKTEVTK